MERRWWMCMVFACLIKQSAALAQTITWLTADFSPCHMPNATSPGYCDEIDALIVSKLSHYQHQFELSSFPRYSELMKTDKQFCTSDLLFSNKRARYMRYSLPLLPILPNGIIHMRGDHRFDEVSDEEQALDLGELLQHELRLGVNEGRVYGTGIDNLLEEYRDVTPTSFVDSELKSIDLLLANRFDYTFGSPAEIGYHVSMADSDGRVQFRPIQNLPKLLLTHYSCTDSPFGRQVIKEINQLIRDKSLFNQMKQYYLAWIPQELVKYYEESLMQAGYIP